MYRFAKRFLAWSWLLGSSLALPLSAATDYAIRAIQIEGNRLSDADVLIALSGLRVGDKIHPASKAVSAAIRKLAKQPSIRSVSIYLTEVDEANGLASLCIQVEEYPRLERFVLEGLSNKDRDALLEKVPIPDDAVLSPFWIQTQTERIKAFFIDKGFRSACVSPQVGPTKAGKALLQINIQKGKPHEVHSILFAGNERMDADRLRHAMQVLKPAPHFTLIKDMALKTVAFVRKRGGNWKRPSLEEVVRYFSNHVSFFPTLFTEKKLEQAKKNLERLYQSQGFRDVRIETERLRTVAPGALQICLKIDEGKQYKIRRMRWVGNQAYPQHRLRLLLNVRPGDLYDPVYIRERLSPGTPQTTTVADLYTNHGYLFFRAEAVEVGLEEDQVDLEIRLYEGKQVAIQKVDIVGNTMTHDCVIRRELTTLPGETFNRARVLESLQNLALLDLFKTEKLVPEIHPNEETGTVDLTYRVAEKPRFDLRLKTEYRPGPSRGMRLEAVLGSNNVALHNLFRGRAPLGGAQQMHLSTSLQGKEDRSVRISFQEPWLWLGGKRYLFALSFDNAHRITKNVPWTGLDRAASLAVFPFATLAHKKSSLTSLGGRIALGKKLAKHWESHLGFDCHRHSYRYHNLLEDGKKRSGALYNIALDFSWAHNSNNDAYFPTAGWSWTNLLTVTPPYTACGYQPNDPTATLPRFKEFGKFTTDFSFFQALFAGFVLNLRAHGGFLHSLSKREIGPFERFHLGGGPMLGEAHNLLGGEAVALRGYPEGSLTPKDYQKGIQGGVLYQKIATELRYPLITDPAYVYALGFFEAGNTWLEYRRFHLFDAKKSVGGGIRIHLPIPIVPTLGMDLGYRLDALKEVHKRKSRLEYHFSMGPSTR